jgi:tetratricopeptide (TPR) repeat protein
LAERLGDPVGVSNALAILGEVANYRGEVAGALALWEECVRASRAAEDATLMTRNLTSLGHAARAAGENVRARGCIEEALAIARQLGIALGEANCLTSLGHLARDEENLPRAMGAYRAALPLYQECGASAYVPWCLEGMAAAMAPAQPLQAARLCGASAALRRALDAPLPPVERRAFEALTQRLTADLGADAFGAAWSAGQALSLDAAIALAMDEDSPE